METSRSIARRASLTTNTSAGSTAAATGAVSVESIVAALCRIVPLAIGESIVAVMVTEPLPPAANVPLFQVTTPLDSLPLPETLVTVSSAGR